MPHSVTTSSDALRESLKINVYFLLEVDPEQRLLLLFITIVLKIERRASLMLGPCSSVALHSLPKDTVLKYKTPPTSAYWGPCSEAPLEQHYRGSLV